MLAELRFGDAAVPAGAAADARRLPAPDGVLSVPERLPRAVGAGRPAGVPRSAQRFLHRLGPTVRADHAAQHTAHGRAVRQGRPAAIEKGPQSAVVGAAAAGGLWRRWANVAVCRVCAVCVWTIICCIL